MGRSKRPALEGANLDMTPMIDVVFQLIIFFIVTFKLEKTKNEDIILEDSRNGPVIESKETDRTLVIEVDKRGWISIHNARMGLSDLRAIMKNRWNRHGEYPVLIRGDARANHKDIRAVMDVCTSVGLWRINFAAVKEHKAKRR